MLRVKDKKCDFIPVLFSIVINNYNYANYLRECIDSALGQIHQPLEVIVVDDGSTDASRAVIESYGERIRAVFQPNGGQGAAVNTGFAACKGDWVLFLDADDKLFPDAVEKIMQSAGVAVSKIQYYLTVIDDRSVPTGVRLPTRPMENGDLRGVVAQFRFYTSPPASGNAYNRRFLEYVLPMPAEKWRISADAYLILAAPFYGFIESAPDALAMYRRHGGGASDSSVVDLSGLRSYVAKELIKEIKREIYVRNLLNEHNYSQHMRPYLSPTYCKYWLMDTELNREASNIHERVEIASRVITCALRWPNYSLKQRLLFTLWCLVVFVLPLPQIVVFARGTLLPHWRSSKKVSGLWHQKA